MNVNLKRNRGICALLSENRNTLVIEARDKYPKQAALVGLILNRRQLYGLAAEKLLVLWGVKKCNRSDYL